MVHAIACITCIACLAGGGCASGGRGGSQAPPPTSSSSDFSVAATVRRVTLIHLSDSEAAVLPHEDTKSGGIARASAVVEALRARSGSGAVVLSAGDLFIPSPELSLTLDGASTVLTRNNRLSLQASVLGNHELDLGEQFLADAIAQMGFPYITATVDVTQGPLHKVVAAVGDVTPWADDVRGKLVPRAKLCAGALDGGDSGPRTCRGTTVGLVGATTEELRLVSGGASKNLVLPTDLAGVRDAVQAQVDALTREGVSFIVLLSHLQGAGRDAELIQSGLHDVDVIVSGGGENRLASARHRLVVGHAPDALCASSAFGPSCYPAHLTTRTGQPVLLVATAGDLEYVGNLVVHLDAAGTLTGYDAAASRPWPVDETSVLELRAPLDKGLLAFQLRVEEALTPLLEVLAPSEVFFDGEREAVRNRETNLANLSADAILRAAARAAAGSSLPLPTLALRNGGGIRASIGTVDPRTGARTPSAIRVLDLKEALRFDSPIAVVTTSHAGLRETLESALRGAGSARGHFPQASSNVILRYSAEHPEQTHVLAEGAIERVVCPGARVRDLVVRGPDGTDIVVVRDGALPTPDAPIALATLEYLAKGGDGWFPARHVPYALLPGVTEQSSLRAFLEEEQRSGRWRSGAAYRSDEPRRIVRVNAPAGDLPGGCAR